MIWRNNGADSHMMNFSCGLRGQRSNKYTALMILRDDPNKQCEAIHNNREETDNETDTRNEK